MSEHTKGPWTIINNNDGECKIMAGAYYICQTFGFSDKDEANANAALIAAVPDMVEALKEIAEDMPKHGYHERRKTLIARKALTKAGVK